MLKEALSYLVGLGKVPNATESVDGNIHLVDRDGRLSMSLEESMIRARWNLEEDELKRNYRLLHNVFPTIPTNTLTSIANYFNDNPESRINEHNRPFIHIKSACNVRLMTMLDSYGKRECIIDSDAIVPTLRFGQKMPVDSFIVMLQSQFAHTEDKDKLLKLVSNMEDKESLNLKDDGIRQSVTVKKGFEAERESIPNPVLLAPFRTFTEVEQPRSYYSLRIYNANELALYEVGGNEWQITAMQNIKAWFVDKLKDKNSVIIM